MVFRRFHAMKMLVMLVLVLGIGSTIHPAQAQDQRCFAETNQCIAGRVRQYWEQNGGLQVFGFPLTPQRDELNRDMGHTYPTQRFERNRFELHPDNAAPYDVLLGRLGDDRLLQIGRNWQQEERESRPQTGCLWFEKTGHNVCNQGGNLGFRIYWEGHGLQDPRLDRYRRSLALFGLPLTAPRTETNPDGDTVLTQWFERARFEWHPDKPDEFKVLLGRLGAELTGARGPTLTGRIAYIRSRDANTGGDLYIMNVDGSGQMRLTTTNALRLNRTEYAVSPAGDRIAYRAGAQLNVITTGGGIPQLFAATSVDQPDEFELFSPTWAPDGSYLAYVLEGDIYARRNGNSSPVRLTMSGDVSLPACLSWAHNGYVTFRTGARNTFRLWVVRSDGSDRRQIAWGLCGTLSPAGDRMVYMNGDLRLVNLDGTNDDTLTSDRNFLPGIWSPDGRRIMSVGYSSDRPDDRNIYVIDVESRGIQQLTSDLLVDSLPDWSPDGQFITFSAQRDGRYGVYVMRADGSDQTRLQAPDQSAWPQWVSP